MMICLPVEWVKGGGRGEGGRACHGRKCLNKQGAAYSIIVKFKYNNWKKHEHVLWSRHV